MANSKFKQLVLGNNVKQDNRTFPPTMGSTPAAFSAPAGMAMASADASYNPGVAYAEGDLLFYTDGATVYDSTGAIMNGGTLNGLSGENKLAQPAVILKSSEAHYYWILTLNSTTGRIYVHNVLMTGNGGRGAVSQNQTITIGAGSAGYITQGAATTDRFGAFYSSSTSQYGIMTHLAASNRWISHVITGVSSHLPVFAALVGTPIGNTYANNDAANHSCVKFNEDNTKMATIYQPAVGTSGTPVLSATVEVYDLDPATGIPSNFTSFTVPIRDAGAVAPGKGNDGRLKAYDLEWDFDSNTLYVPIYDITHGLGINYYTLNASNVVTSSGVVPKSMSNIGANPDRAIFGMFKDPYEDRIYVNKPAVVGTSGGYSVTYNDTYATDEISVIKDTSTPSGSEFVQVIATTVSGDTIGAGTPTRPMAGEEAGPSSYYTLTPCDTQKEYIMDTLGSIWVLDGALDATKIADVSSISDRVNIAVQKETNFIYLLAGTGATPKIYKIDPVTGTVDAGTTVSGTSITGFKSISSKDGDALKLYAVIEISGPHYNYAEIVIATGVATKTAGNTAHVAVDTAYIGSTLYMASGDDLYKNTGPGTWATVGANGLSKNYEGLSTDDTILYGYIESKRYTINTSTGAATNGKSITINSSTGTWNYTAQGAGIVNVATLTTNDTNPGAYVDQVINVTNFGGCYTVTTAGSGSTAIGDILSHSADCGSCSSVESDDYCKLLISCCDSGYRGLRYTREIVGTTDDPTCNAGSYYEITANAQNNDQLNRCVQAEESDDALYLMNSSRGYKIDLTTGILASENIQGGSDIAFNKHGVGFISGASSLYYTIPGYGQDYPNGSTNINIPQSTTISFNYSDELITGGVVSGVTQVSRHSISKKGILTTINTLTNSNVLLTGDLAVDKITGNYYCVGDSSPTSTPETNDLFKLDPSTLVETHIASLTSTLSLSAWQNVKAIEIVKDSCYVVVWDSKTYAITLYRINKDTGSLISSLAIISSDGTTEFLSVPTGLGYNNPCLYWDTGAFKLVNYTDCSTCFASSTSKNCCFELVDCETGVSTITSTDVSAYLDDIIVTDTPGKCYQIYTYDNSITCTGVDVNVTKTYTSCSECTGVQTTCYRLLKCDDPTSDPKYTSDSLTPMIKNKVGKTVQLEGEHFCRNVDNQGNAVELMSATAQTIKSTKKSCTKCNFYLKLKQCGAQNIVRYVDYTSSTTLHPFIGSGAVKIQNLGKDENKVCWEIDPTIYGPSSTLRPTASLVLSGPDCTICNAHNNEASQPAQVVLTECCGIGDPNTPNTTYWSQNLELVDAVIEGNLMMWGNFTNYDGTFVSGCFEINFTPQPVAQQFVIGQGMIIEGLSSDATKCAICPPEYVECLNDSGNSEVMIHCRPTNSNITVDASTFEAYDDDLKRVYNFGEVGATGCWRRCWAADHIHGVNWFWGAGASLTWSGGLSNPGPAATSASQMALNDAQLNSTSQYTKFGSCVHNAHELCVMGSKTYNRTDLMFYSDGRFVYNSNHQAMAGSMNGAVPLLLGGVPEAGAEGTQFGAYASQQCVTIPKPDSSKFPGTNTYTEYYLIYQRPGLAMPLYAVINMNTNDGLGEILTYNQELPPAPTEKGEPTILQSTERLTVTSRPAIPDSQDDEYWIMDVIPYQNDDAGAIGDINCRFRAWKVDNTGISSPVQTPVDGAIGPVTAANNAISEWARVKCSPTNNTIGISGMSGSYPWLYIMQFNWDTGKLFGWGVDFNDYPESTGWSWQMGFGPNITANCYQAFNDESFNSDWPQDYAIPYTFGFEFHPSGKGIYVLRSGMSWPPNCHLCQGYEPWNLDGDIPLPPPSIQNELWFHSITNSEIEGSNYGVGNMGQPYTANLDETLPKAGLNALACPGMNPAWQCGECVAITTVQNSATYHNVSNPPTRLDSVTGEEVPNPLMPLLQASIITDLHMGPDQALYAGIVLGESTGSISNWKNWKNTLLGIGGGEGNTGTPEYNYAYTNGGIGIGSSGSEWTPSLDGPSSQRIASTAFIKKYRVESLLNAATTGEGMLVPGTSVTCSEEWFAQSAIYGRSAYINGVIDFGFPQYVRRMCYAGDEDALVVTVTGYTGSCEESNITGMGVDFGACNPVEQADVFQINSCTQSNVGCDGEGCTDYGSGDAFQLDGIHQRFGMTEFLDQDIRDAIEQLDTGPQAVYLTYSFVQEGTIIPATWFCNSLGTYTVPKHESGPTTTLPQGACGPTQGICATGTAYDKTYTITEAQFRAEIGKAFDMVSQLFEATFSPQNGYPNQLTLKFTDLGEESGTAYAGGISQDFDTWSTTAPIGFSDSATGVTGVGDFRIMMGRHSNWCNMTGNMTSGCTGCNNTGEGGSYLAWATGPSYLSQCAGYDGTTGTYNQDSTLATREGGWRNITFDVNENWRKTDDAQVWGTFEIVRVGLHEILHSFGFNHAYESMSNNEGCEGTTSRGTAAQITTVCNNNGNNNNYSFLNSQGYFSCELNGLYNSTNGVGDCCQASTSWGDPDAIMAPTAGSSSFTTDYAEGVDTNWDSNACYMSGPTPAARQDREMCGQVYGFGLSYNSAGENFCYPLTLPDCVSYAYYSNQELLWDYVGGGTVDTTFTWDSGSGLACWYPEVIAELPAGAVLTNIVPATNYPDCDTCGVQFQPDRWRLILCEECPENGGNGAPGEIITSTDFSEFCSNPFTVNDGMSGEVFEFVGYTGCYRVDCNYDAYIDYVETPAAVVVSTVSDDCDACCNNEVISCYTITQCADSNPISFVAAGDVIFANYVGIVCKFESLPPEVLALGLTTDDCFTIESCGICNTTDCEPLVGPSLLVPIETWPGCYSCMYENPNQDCFTLTCCSDNSGDTLINVLPNADLNGAFVNGLTVLISEYPDAVGNARCWEVSTQDLCNPEIQVTVLSSYPSCAYCETATTVQGCTDSTALNYCPGCTTCLDPIYGTLNDCCIYAGCPLSCLEPTALNYNPNATCDCNGVAGGSDTSCCNYPPIVIPPEGVDVTFEKDCVNCLDWATVDKVFANAAELCGHCYPPKGLTLLEYDCALLDNVETVITTDQSPGGCTDPGALNYDPAAEWDNGTCYWSSACTDPTACNFDPNAVESIPSDCVYPGECGCEDYTDSCVGCMDLTACNYCEDCTVPDNTLCEYASCYGCTDPEAENYCADCTQMCPNADCCASDVEACLDNRNIYVFYDMTSITSSSNNNDKLQACVNLRTLVEGAMNQIITDNNITNFSGKIYHLAAGLAWDNVQMNDWRGGSSDPANWLDYYDLTTTTNEWNSAAMWRHANWNNFQNDFTGAATNLAGTGFNQSQSLGGNGGERWMQWMLYPLHGNSNKLNPALKVSFSNVNNVVKSTGAEVTIGNYNETSRLLAKSLCADGLDGNGDYINNLPGTQVNPFNDPAGMEGFSDVYHEFEGGDTNPVIIMFIDESEPVYYPNAPVSGISYGTPLVSANVCGAGVNPSAWYDNQAISTTAYIDYMWFTECWERGYDFTGADDMTVKNPTGAIGTGYKDGNFNAILFPTKLVGEPNTGDNLTFISMAYGVIGQGSPDATGHISCSDFVDIPWATGVSMAPYTNPNITNPWYDMDRSGSTTQMADNSVCSPGTYSPAGFSLRNYNVSFEIPGGDQELLQISTEALAEAILQGLLCNNNG